MLIHRTSAFLLILAFFAQAFSRYLIVADYYVNTSAYMENCVNKERPWMHCNGRCQLCKKLHQQNNSEDKQTPERKSGNNGNETLYSSSSFAGFTGLRLVALINLQYPESPGGKPVGRPRTLFHPPGGRLA